MTAPRTTRPRPRPRPRLRDRVTAGGRRRTVAQFARYGLVGCLNLAVFTGLFVAVSALAPYVVAHLVAYGVTMVVAAVTHSCLTYRVRPTRRTLAALPGVFLANSLLSTLLLLWLVEGLHAPRTLAAALAAMSTAPIGFAVSKMIVFARTPPPRG